MTLLNQCYWIIGITTLSIQLRNLGFRFSAGLRLTVWADGTKLFPKGVL